MLTAQEKEFYATLAWRTARLSDCEQKHGAVAIKIGDHSGKIRERRLFYGMNRKLTASTEIPAIMDVLSNFNITEAQGCILFTTKFPRFLEMIQILTYGVSILYFFGDIDDADAVRLVNEWNSPSNKWNPSHNCLEIVKLETNKNISKEL